LYRRESERELVPLPLKERDTDKGRLRGAKPLFPKLIPLSFDKERGTQRVR